MGVSNSRQQSTTPNPDQETNVDNQESKPPTSSRRQLPSLPLLCAPCTCTKGGCNAICDPRETHPVPASCCGSCEGSAISAICCGPCQVTSANIQYFAFTTGYLLPYPSSSTSVFSFRQHPTAWCLLRRTSLYQWSDALFCSNPSTCVQTNCSKWRNCLNNV